MSGIYLVSEGDPYEEHESWHPLRAFSRPEDAEAFRVERYEAIRGPGTAGETVRPRSDRLAIDGYYRVTTIELD